MHTASLEAVQAVCRYEPASQAEQRLQTRSLDAVHAADWKWSEGHDVLQAWQTVSECPEHASAMNWDEVHVVHALHTVLACALHATAV